MILKFSKYKWCVRCEGDCIKPCEDIVERYYKSLKACRLFMLRCRKRLVGYRCFAQIWKRGWDV